MDPAIITIDQKRLNDIVKSTQKAYEQIRPQIEYSLELALKTQKEIEPYLAQIIRQFQSMQPYILGSSEVYLVSPMTPNKPIIHNSGTELLPPRIKLGKSVAIVGGNSFKYKQKTLRAISLNSKPGKLLHALLESRDHFVTDKVLFDKLGVEDARNLSFVVRDLRTAFKKNHLEIIIEDRKKPDGYILISIEKQG